MIKWLTWVLGGGQGLLHSLQVIWFQDAAPAPHPNHPLTLVGENGATPLSSKSPLLHLQFLNNLRKTTPKKQRRTPQKREEEEEEEVAG